MKTPTAAAPQQNAAISVSLEQLRNGALLPDANRALRATIRNNGRTVAYFDGRKDEAKQLVSQALKAGASHHAIGNGYDFTFIRMNEAAQAAWDEQPAPQAAPAASTPTPWRWSNDYANLRYDEDTGRVSEKYLDLGLIGANGEYVIPLRVDHYEVELDARLTGMSNADRALIVLAVNSRAGLLAEVARLREALARLVDSGLIASCADGSGSSEAHAELWSRVTQARAALAQGGGK